MSSEVRAWLTALLATDDRMGRLVGAAVTVLFDAGAHSSLIAEVESSLREEHPAVALDHSYQRQLELLQEVLRGRGPALPAQRLRGQVEAFRVRKEVAKATLAHADGRSAKEPVDELLRDADGLERRLGGPPETLRELRLGSEDLRLLYAAGSPDTATLLVAGIGGDWEEWYEEALHLARADLRRADDDFAAYDKAAFLTAYFPGREAEIQAAAARLVSGD